MGRRRASRNITLVLIGTAALAGCGQEQQLARDHYASLEDCAADWGRPEQCDRVQSPAYPGAAYIFRGPLYGVNRRDTARNEAWTDADRAGQSGFVDRSRQGRSIGTSIEPTSRGGFGSRSRSFSSIGS